MWKGKAEQPNEEGVASAAEGSDSGAGARSAADTEGEAQGAGEPSAGSARDGAGSVDDAGDAGPPGSQAEPSGDDRPQPEGRAWQQRAEVAEEALAAERERVVRLQADFENFRRRTRQEQAGLESRALDPFIKELLPVMDNLDRAVVAAKAGDASSSEALLQGVEMVQRQLVELLAGRQVEAMVTLGEPFDPHRHEAVQRVDADGYVQDTVTEEWQKGYVREGRVLRPAMVKVAGGSQEAQGVLEEL